MTDNKPTHPGTLREFSQALRKSFTYDPSRNLFLIFGVVWGLPVPIFTLGTLLLIHEGTWSQIALEDLLLQYPSLWFFVLYPIFFGIILGAIGTIRYEKDMRIGELINRLNRESRTDPLTGLSNRRHFLERFREAMNVAQKDGAPLSVAMFDLDKFKDFNDTHGHEAGDVVLRHFAQLLDTGSRGGDLPARWGGEEFILVMPNTTIEEATGSAERIRRTLEKETIEYDGQPLKVTTSAGVTQFKQDEEASDFFNRADERLYTAKAAGRNQISVSD